ncbi:MAG TPA: hypothetical protein VEK11_04875 [Thermoanaerobaculia bacterium]|nr:hypothetical protein [Thermoanaerobaculia bacterium]
MPDEELLRTIIRATARSSAVCIAFAFARIRTREFLLALPVSHGLHYAAILTLAFLTSPSNAHIGVTSMGGVAIYALMLFAARRPENASAVYALWIIFIIGFVVRDMSNPVYPAVMTMLVGAGIVRAVRAQMRPASVQSRP